jgi:hypothetical protein
MLHLSIITHILSGAIMLYAFMFLIIYFSKIQQLDVFRMLILILLFSIIIGIHGISHLGLEKEYQYVPFNLWKLSYKDIVCPCMKHKSVYNNMK